MKKVLVLLLLFVSATGSLQAQTFAEWFQQKKTQKKYLLQQIAALQVYIGYAQKGYKIAKEGLTTISGFTKGEFNLHGDYFNSLKTVNPKVRKYVKVADIISLQVKIVQDYNRTYGKLAKSDAFSSEEQDYIRRVFGRLLNDCEQTLDALIAVTTDGKLEMKDNERMKRIDQLYTDMQDKYTFSKSFSNDASLIAAARIKEQTEIQTSRALQGIKNE
ncbi:TerB family tellurite resistance protein [Sediminibacterium sp.]|nr:TerB family tellurite resistance protein [Sediminibacterium sp.]